MGNSLYDVNLNQNIIQQYLKTGILFLSKKEIDFKTLYCIFMNDMSIKYMLWIQDNEGDCIISIGTHLVSGYITKFGKDYCNAIKNGYTLEEYYNKGENIDGN